MAWFIAMLEPPVVLVAGSRPAGQLPAKPASSRTVSSPPRCGSPARGGAAGAGGRRRPGAAGAWGEEEPPPQAAASMAVATRTATFIRCLIYGLLWGVIERQPACR